MKYFFPKKFKTIIVFCFIIPALSPSIDAQTLNEALSETYKFNYAQALKILESLPKTPVVLRHLAWTYLRVRNYQLAEEIFLTLDQNDYEILLGTGLCYFLQRKYEKSFLYFKKSLESNKNCAASEYFCGEIKNIQGFTDQAIGHYKNTLKLDYSFVEARLRLAQSYDNIKEYDNAFGEWTKLAYTDPQFKEAEYRKQALLALITKKPEEIVPPQKIFKGTVISSAPNPEAIPLLRIGIVGGVQELSLWGTDGLVVYEGDKKIFETGPNELLTIDLSTEVFKNKRQIILRTKSNSSGIIIRNIKYARGFAWAGISDREYRGYSEINFSDTGFSLINIVNIEEYLYSVLPSEMIASWPKESLKAQAVIARSEALYKKNVSKPHKKDSYDLCDDQHCQVYKGVKQETSLARDAVNLTRGEILTDQNKIIHSLYSSNCSGHTQSSKELKGWGDEPYLSGIIDGDVISFPKDLTEFELWIKHPPDIFCAPSKYTYYTESRWIKVTTQDELSEILNRSYNLGGIKKIIPLKKSRSGHINHLKIEGTKGMVEIEKENLIRAIALGKLRSTNFIVEGYGTKKGLPQYFIFWGAGWGHAVGLCQSGAAAMAEKGFKYDEILKKYFYGARIKKIEY